MGRRLFWRAALSSTVMLLGLSAGCELIFPFDRTKIDSDGGAGGATVTGGGGTTSSSTTTKDPCSLDSECPEPAEECQVAKCDTVTGMCGQKAVMNGTAAAIQTDQDCKKNVCTGGVVTEVGDPNDVYNDGNDCTDDICDANNDPVSAPSAAGTACNVNSGKLCDGAGACVECLMDADCVGTAYCDAGICAAKKNNGTGCIGANECTSGFCADTVCCDTACAGTCRACSAAKTGQPNGTCSFVSINTDPDNECASTDACNFGACAFGQGASCFGSFQCATGYCVDGVCCDTDCADTCKSCDGSYTNGPNGTCSNIKNHMDPDDECGGVLNCTGMGACEPPLPTGMGCALDAECLSTHCVDGWCCNTACNGQCQSCGLFPQQGNCLLSQAGSDPRNECSGGTPDCNGQGGCGLGAAGVYCVPNSGSVCVNGYCPAAAICP